MSAVETLITKNLATLALAVRKKSTSGRGSSKKIELYGIKKVRELILELAVRGKLVPQDPEDEPASVLLERIEVEKSRLTKGGKAKKQKALSAVNNDEKPFQAPIGWEWTRLGSISEISPRNDVTDDMEASFVPMPLISTSHHGRHSDETKLWRDIKKGYTHFASGDIAIAKITPCFENSKAAVFSGLKNGIGAGTTELHVARPYGKTLDAYYILLYLKAPQFLLLGETKMTGSAGQKRVPKNFFAGNPLPLPPLQEQHRIVAKVDELMALCDQIEQQTEASLAAHSTLVKQLLDTLTNSANAPELEQNWNRIAEHFTTLFTTEESIDQLKQTILQLAVMGKLVPQDPDDEPASVLLEKIAAEKALLIKEKKIKKQKPLPPIGEDEKPFALPEGWEWSRLPDIGELSRGKSKHRPRNDPILYSEGTIPLVQTGDVSGSKYSGRVIKTYTALYNKNGVSQSRLWPVGTMCITIAANIADTGILGFDACFPDSVVGFNPYDTKMEVNYFEYFIQTVKDHLEEFAPSTAQKNINLEILSTLLVPLPPLAELKKIVAKVDQLITLCDQIKTHLKHQQQTRLQLVDAMVESALD